jgi:FAD/FMN-containing dehydrogenase
MDLTNINQYLLQKLKTFLDKEGVEFSEAEVAKYAKDVSIFKMTPSLVVFPKNVAEISKLVTFVKDLKVAIYKNIEDEAILRLVDNILEISVQAGATCMSGGSLTTGVMLDLKKYLNKISTVKNVGGEFSIDVESGVWYRDIEKVLDKQNLFFPGYTSSKDICGIGGMLGNNSSGEMSVLYGATIDNVLALEVVVGNGQPTSFYAKKLQSELTDLEKGLLQEYTQNIVRLTKEVGEVKKSASGYALHKIVETDGQGEVWVNLAKMFVGAQGTLGIITKAKLKLFRRKQVERMLLVPVPDLSLLPKVLAVVQNYQPECVETFDINTFTRAEKKFPESFNLLKSFFQKSEQMLVLAQLADDNVLNVSKVISNLKQDLDTIKVNSFIADEKVQAAAWQIRRASFTLVRDSHRANERAVPCIEDIIVPTARFAEFIPKLQSLLAKYNLPYGFHGHIGDGALRIVPLFDFSQKDVVEMIKSFTQDAALLMKELHGNTSADHGDGIIRTPFLPTFYSLETIELFVRIKGMFDPYNLFNNKKKTNFDPQMIDDYFDREGVEVVQKPRELKLGEVYKLNKEEVMKMVAAAK